MQHRATSVAATCLLALFAASAPAAADDRYTGVPIYPGDTDRNPTTIDLTCPGDRDMRVSLYLWKPAATETPDAIVTWYARTLRGSKVVHHADVDVTFVSAADGSNGAVIRRAGRAMMLRLYRLTPPAGATDLYGQHCTPKP